MSDFLIASALGLLIMLLSCAMPSYPFCNSLFGWAGRASTRLRVLSTGQDNCLSRAGQPRFFSDLNRWGLGFASSRALPLQVCQKVCADYVESSDISESSRLNFSGSMGVGRQSTSIRACLARSEWTSDGVCHFPFLPASILRTRRPDCARQ